MHVSQDVQPHGLSTSGIGTQYPQPVTVSGDQVDLTSIYWQGERIVTVTEDDTNIAILTGPANPLDPNQYDYINRAEIETLETANRANPIGSSTFNCGLWNRFTCTRYHLYGVVVNDLLGRRLRHGMS